MAKALSVDTVIEVAARAGEKCERSVFSSSTGLRKAMESRGIDTRTPGLRGKERKNELLERFCAYFYAVCDSNAEVEKQSQMREGELKAVRVAAQEKGMNTQTPGLFGEERKNALLERMFAARSEGEENGIGSDSGGDERTTMEGPVDAGSLKVGMWNSCRTDGIDAGAFAGSADDAARVKEIKEEIESAQAQIADLTEEVNTMLRIQSDKLKRRMTKITDEDCGVARLVERVARTERDLRNMEAVHASTTAVSFQDMQQAEALRRSGC